MPQHTKGSTVFSAAIGGCRQIGRPVVAAESNLMNAKQTMKFQGSHLQDHIDQVVTNAVHATMSKAMSTTTRRDYRNRIKRFIKGV